MLGNNKIEKRFYETLKFLLGLEASVGIIGEKPKSALFVIGCHEDKAIVLDPHCVKNACKTIEEFYSRIEDYFSRELMTVKFKELGSSMSFGFYFRNAHEFTTFKKLICANAAIVKNLIMIKDKTVVLSEGDSIKSIDDLDIL